MKHQENLQARHAAGEVELSIPLSPLAPRAARLALEDAATGVPQPALVVAQLLLSELVSNSVRHSNLPPDSPIHVRFQAAPETLRIEVEDSGWGFTVPPSPTGDDHEGGWGLYVMSYLADRWGIERPDVATRVWFEVDLA
jgi:anti-sigma regulatory factor (Ser/Thr protein kinase)